MAKKSNETTTTNLRDLVSTGGSEREKKIAEEKKASDSVMIPHGFSSKGIVLPEKIIDNIDDLLKGDDEHMINIPFMGVNYVSLVFSKEYIEKLILTDERLNPKIELPKWELSELDAKLAKSSATDSFENAVANLYVEEITSNGKIDSDEGEPEKEHLIRSIQIVKDKVYLLLNNRVMIKKFIPVTILSSMIRGPQINLNKEAIPTEVRQLMVENADEEFINRDDVVVGRVDKNLALEVSVNRIMKNIVIPRLIVPANETRRPKTITQSILDLKKKYFSMIKISSLINNKSNSSKEGIYLAIESSGEVRSHELKFLINKEELVCVNSSFEVNKVSKVLKNIVSRVTEDKFKQAGLGDHLNIGIEMIPISALNKHTSVKGVPLVNMYKGQTVPLFVPIIEIVDRDKFIKVQNGSLFNSYLFKNSINRCQQPDIEKINKVFGDFIDNADPFLSETYSSYERDLVLIPNIKKLILSMFLDRTDDRTDYAISVVSDENILAVSFNRKYK